MAYYDVYEIHQLSQTDLNSLFCSAAAAKQTTTSYSAAAALYYYNPQSTDIVVLQILSCKSQSLSC